MVFLTTNNPAQWLPPSGHGFINFVGFEKFQDNLGNLIIDNLGNNIVTNPIQVVGKYATLWASTGV